jgi:hypothetical protein
VLLGLAVCAALKVLARVVALYCESIKTTIIAVKQRDGCALRKEITMYMKLLTRYLDCSTSAAMLALLPRCHSLL